MLKVVKATAIIIVISLLFGILPSSGFSKATTKKSISYAKGKLIIKFKTNPSLTDRGIVDSKISSIDKLNEKNGVYEAEKVFKGRAGKSSRLKNTYEFDIPKSKNVKEVIELFEDNPNVEYAEPDFIVKDLSVPNDPSYSSQWALPKISAPAAWEKGTGQGVTVAVIDTGVDYTHPDLNDNIWTNPGEIAGNSIDDDGNGYVDDYYGWDFAYDDNNPMDGHYHGTHVAGIIAAEANNSIGVAGLAYNSKIMPVKFLSDSGSGYTSDAVAAIIYAANNGADVLNNSWGGGGYSQTLANAIDYAHDTKNAVFVAAAGNSGTEVYNFYPASYKNAVAVSATNNSDTIAYFSNWGAKIDVAAPGVSILSTFPNSNYSSISGTSMATPYVSAAAALILAKNPALNPEKVRQIIKTSSDDLGDTGWDPYYGAGRINASNALDYTDAGEAFVFGSTGSVSSSFQIKGTAKAPSFSSYRLEIGTGDDPSSWTTLAQGNSQIENTSLIMLNPEEYGYGFYTIRMIAIGDRTYEYRILNYFNVSSPPPDEGNPPPDEGNQETEIVLFTERTSAKASWNTLIYGYLLNKDTDEALLNKTVVLKANGQNLTSLNTGDTGVFYSYVSPDVTTEYQTFFEGDDTYGASQSNKVRISIIRSRPVIRNYQTKISGSGYPKTAVLNWKIADEDSNQAYVKLKILKKVNSNQAKKRKNSFLLNYKKAKRGYLKAKKSSAKKAAFYGKMMYFRKLSKSATAIKYATVLAKDFGLIDINISESYNFKATRGNYKYILSAVDTSDASAFPKAKRFTVR